MELINREFWKNKKVFVTGGCGFVGSHLVKKLTSLGAIVKLFVHYTQPPTSDLIGYTGSLSYNYPAIEYYLSEFQPDIIFHLAAQPIVGIAMEQEVDTAEINVRGTYYFLHACKNISSIKSILHVSTDKVFGKVEEIKDDSPLLGSAHPYNASKLCGDIMAQMYAEAYNLPIIIVRNGNIYGPGDLHWDRLIPGTIKRIYNNKQPIWRGGSRDYIYVDDIIDGYLNLVEVRYGIEGLETVNLGAEQPIDSLQVIDMIGALMGSDMNVQIEKLWKGELMNQHIISEKAKRLISWCPAIPFELGLPATIKWYRNYFSWD